MKIGAYALPNPVFVAPMAGITDRPFRRLARRYGAALAVCEMVSARPELRGSRKTLLRITRSGRAALADQRARRAGWLAEAIEHELSPAEQRALARAVALLARLATHD